METLSLTYLKSFFIKFILATSLPRKDPLSFQNPSFHHVNINNNDLIPIHGVSNKVNENKKLFDDLEESNNYLQESLGYPKLNHKGEECQSTRISIIF